jgi:nucleotide-binding universal stress UspA family protein
MYKRRILVPVNFTSQSDAALHYAMKIASAINGMITCLYINEEPDRITGQFLTKDISDRIRRSAEDTLSVKANEILNTENKTPFEVIVTTGKVHRKIREKAKDLNVNLIVMGKSDSEDSQHSQLGSNTNRIIAKANIPVLTVSNTKHIGSSRILLPLDLSKTIEVKLLKAIELSKMLGSQVNVFTVMPPDWVSVKLKFQKRLKEIQQYFNMEGIICSIQLKVSGNSIPEEILAQARKMGAGMIMMMTQQEKSITDLFIGSNVQQIINESEVPVLSIIPTVRTNEISNTAVWSEILNPIPLIQMN